MRTQKTQKNLRISDLTERQLNELQERLTLSHTETITLAVDRLHHAELSDVESLRDSVLHLRSVIAKLESTSFADWPQWSTADFEAIERLVSEFGWPE